jgi:hypothetical protein
MVAQDSCNKPLDHRESTLGTKENEKIEQKNTKTNRRKEEGETETDIERGGRKKGKQKRGRPPRKPQKENEETLIDQGDAGVRKNNTRK